MMVITSRIKQIVKGGVVLGAIILLGACASSKPPAQKMAKTEAAIKQAKQVGAEDYAPLEIREARKKLRQAKELIAEKEFEKARRLADRAEVDAELAEAKTLSEKAQDAVDQLRQSISILKEEIKRNQHR